MGCGISREDSHLEPTLQKELSVEMRKTPTGVISNSKKSKKSPRGSLTPSDSLEPRFIGIVTGYEIGSTGSLVAKESLKTTLRIVGDETSDRLEASFSSSASPAHQSISPIQHSVSGASVRNIEQKLYSKDRDMKSSKSLLVASKTQLSMSKKSSFGSSTKVMSPTMGRSPTLVSPLKVTNALDSISGSDESVKKGIKLSSTEPNLDLKLKRRQTDPVKRKYPEASLPIGSMDSLSSEVDKAKEVDMKTRHEAFTNRTSTEDSIMIIVSQEGKITRTDTITTRRRFLAEQPSFIGAEVDPLMVLPRRLTEASVECSDSDILIDQVDPTPISPIENLLV